MATRTKKKKASAGPPTPAEVEAMINKEFGAGTVVRGSDAELEITRIPTGILSLDLLLNGGFARGRHVEIYGGYSAGKTSTFYRAMANAQAMGLNAGFLDAEGTFDPVFAEMQGVDLDKLTLMPRQEHGEQTINMMEIMLRSGTYDILGVDSISALLPKVERDTSMDKATYGTAQAKMMSTALRRLTAANRRTVLGYINQQRESIGSMFQKWTTSGGRAMSFYAGTRLEMTRIESLKKQTVVIDPKSGNPSKKNLVVAHRVLVKVDKDKTGVRPQSTTTMVFDYRLGRVDHIEDLMYLGRTYGLIGKKGAQWWVKGMEDEKSTGRGSFKSWLRTNVAVAEELEEEIWDAYAESDDAEEPDMPDALEDPEDEEE